MTAENDQTKGSLMTVILVLIAIAIIASVAILYRRVTRGDGMYGPTAVK